MKFITRKPNVAVLLRTSAKTYREILDGILRYTRERSPWTLQFCQGREAKPEDEFSNLSRCDGVIIDETNELFGNLSRFNGHPLVSVTNTQPKNRDSPNRISLYCDNLGIGRKAAEHFLEKGFDSFAYVNDPSAHKWSILRGDAFSATLGAAEKTCEIYTPPATRPSSNRRQPNDGLSDWLHQLPKPVALLAANDLVARHVLDCCAKLKIPVPGDVAILGCDNEEPICETSVPPLSSIAFSTEQAGYEAARALDLLLRRKQLPSTLSRFIPYGPVRIVSRLSSERRNISDTLVDRALGFIRLNATSPFSVNDLAKTLHVSRRTLETRFRKSLARGVHEELLQTRLQLAREQLQMTSLPVEEIAQNCGFPNASHLGVMFKRRFKMTPSDCRKCL